MDAIESLYIWSDLSAQWFSILFCFFVAWVVSIDAVALTFCQQNDFRVRFRGENDETRNVFGAGMRHAFWHAFLFFSYMALIELFSWTTFLFAYLFSGAFNALMECLSALAPFFELFKIEDFDDFMRAFRRTFNTAIGVGTIILVWLTYREKVIENHKLKLEDGISFGRRKDIEGLFRALRCLPFIRRFADHALALTVAIDMLAVTAVIRVKFAWVSDAAEGEGWHFSFWNIPSWPGHIADFFTFIFILTIVVFFFTAISGIIVWGMQAIKTKVPPNGTRLSERAGIFCLTALSKLKPYFLFVLRAFEPFLIFVILGTTISHMFVGPLHTGAINWPLSDQILIVLGFGVLLTACLVFTVRPSAMWKAVKDGKTVTIRDHPQFDGLKLGEQWVIFRAFFSTIPWRPLAKSIIVSFCLLLLIFMVGYVQNDARQSLANFSLNAAVVVGGISILCLVSPENWFQQERLIKSVSSSQLHIGKAFCSRLHLGFILSATTVLGYLQIIFAGNASAAYSSIDPVVGALILPIFLFECAFLFLVLRSIRASIGGTPYIITASEFWTAILAAIFLAQLGVRHAPNLSAINEHIQMQNFLFPSILMGLGIAIDVAIATVARFRDNTMTFKSWTLPVALTHILLPAFGYYGWWFLGQQFEGLGLILGLLAFAMIAVFVYEAICEWIGAKPIVSLEPLTNWIFRNADQQSRGRFVMIMAVSMDALWSGPAKAAQAASGQWSPFEVFVSFFIAGVVVAVVAQVSLLAAFALRRSSFSNNHHLAIYLVGGKYFEATILFAFGLLSLWNAFALWVGLGTLADCIIASGGLMLIVWWVFRRRLMREQVKELQT